MKRGGSTVTQVHGDLPKNHPPKAKYCPIEQAPPPAKLKQGRRGIETPAMNSDQPYRKARRNTTNS